MYFQGLNFSKLFQKAPSDKLMFEITNHEYEIQITLNYKNNNAITIIDGDSIHLIERTMIDMVSTLNQTLKTTCGLPDNFNLILKHLKNNHLWFEIDDYNSDSILLTTREGGNIGDSQHGEKDYLGARKIVVDLQNRFGLESFRYNIKPVDEWTFLTIRRPR